MTVNDIYGSRAHGSAELAGIVAGRLGLTFVERESDYRGVYYVVDVSPYHIEVQPNAIPGDDDQDDFYDPDHPQAQTLLLVTGPNRVSALDASLDTIDALELLKRN